MAEGLDVCMGLHAGAEDPEASWRRSEVNRRNGCKGDSRDGSGTHLSDKAAVHERKWLAGSAAQQLYHSHVGGQAEFCITGVEGDGFNGHAIACENRHDGEPAVAEASSIAGAQNRAWWLLDAPRGEIDECLADGRDELVVGENGANILLGEEHGHWPFAHRAALLVGAVVGAAAEALVDGLTAFEAGFNSVPVLDSGLAHPPAEQDDIVIDAARKIEQAGV